MRLPSARLRAISPVIALIIVIGVTLAIAFAVVGWLFGLWGGLAGGVPQIVITSVDAYYNTNDKKIYVEVYMMNKGTADDIILKAYITHKGEEKECSADKTSITVGFADWVRFTCPKDGQTEAEVGDSFILRIFFKNSGAMTVSGVISRSVSQQS